jgi:hypothetical protein
MSSDLGTTHSCILSGAKIRSSISRFGDFALIVLVFAASAFGAGSPASSSECSVPVSPLHGVTIPGDISAKLSFAGAWIPVPGVAVAGGAPGPTVISFFATGPLGVANTESIVAGGWIFESPAPSKPYAAEAAVFSEDSMGLMQLQPASEFGGSLRTHGAGAVYIVDFNHDGVNDIFFPAHNEAPFALESSTVFISTPNGYKRIDVGDSVEDHGSSIFNYNGNALILGANFDATMAGPLGTRGFPVYQYNSKSDEFSVTYTPTTLVCCGGPGGHKIVDINGESIAAANFSNDNNLEAVIGFNDFGPGLAYSANDQSVNLYKFDDLSIGSFVETLSHGYFDGKPQFAGCPSFWDPHKTEQYFARAIDLNGDDQPDVAIGEQIWSPSAGESASKVAVLVNHGDLKFSDETDSLMSEMPLNTFNQHEPTFADFDGSGAQSLFLGGINSQKGIENDVLLLNDGTGKFHLYLLKQFDTWTDQIATYIQEYISASLDDGYYYNGDSNGVSYQPYFTSGHRISFLAFISTGKRVDSDFSQALLAVSVPVTLDPNIDFTRDVAVTVDPLSPAAHGWAGNDTFTVGVGTHRIDGGLGLNTAVFSGKRSEYSIVAQADGSTLVTNVKTRDQVDRLARIQKLRFANETVTLSVPPIVVANPIPNQTWTPGEKVDFQLSAVTFAGNQSQPLTLSVTQSGGTALPSWLTFSPSTATFRGIVPPHVSQLTITVTAKDDSGHSVSSSFKVAF